MPEFHFNQDEGLIICHARISRGSLFTYVPLILDTGATTTIISLKAARRIGLLADLSPYKTILTTSWNKEACSDAILPGLSCLGMTRRNLRVICHDIPPGSRAEGLLGLNFFKNTNLNIEFPKGLVSITK